MGIDARHLSEHVVVPALKSIGMYSADAAFLLLATCAHESDMGCYLKQIKGPALGIYQMEPATYFDIWDNFIKYRDDIRVKVFNHLMWNHKHEPPVDLIITNLAYATIMARLHYARFKEPLPSHKNIKAVYRYYKKYYNTVAGKATEEVFIEDVERNMYHVI